MSCYRTRVECAGFCLSKEDCFAFQFDDPKRKCTLLQENGICTAYKDSETFIYAKNDEQKTIVKCRKWIRLISLYLYNIFYDNYNLTNIWLFFDPACKTKKGEKCIFPFKWWWSTYDGCVTCSNVQCDAPNTWCATELEDDLKYKNWGLCDPSCDVAGT